MKPASVILFFAGLVYSLTLTAQVNQRALTITHLTGDFYVYTTYRPIAGKPFPSNSMYVVTDAGIVTFDTPWDTTQFQPLMDSIENRHHKPVVLCVATHFHADRTAGLDFLKQKGIKTMSSKLTYDLCTERREKQAAYYFTKDTAITIGSHTFQTYYPGEGHTKDNIVIWFSKERILYGGCFVKSVENSSLGNVTDANIPEWGNSMKRTIKKYGQPAYIIPGHFGWESNKALQHTLKLISEGEK